MLDKIFAKPLKFTVGEQTLYFMSIADFEFCLSGRTSVPSSKITDLVKCTTKQLRMEARTIKNVEKRFIMILLRSIEDPQSISHLLKKLDTSIFSQDHGWRNIIVSLHEGGDEFNIFRRMALVKYMQYLSSRQDIIRYLYSEKKKVTSGKKENGGNQHEAERFKETLLFKNPLLENNSANSKNSKFERMSKGEPVIATLKANECVVIMLSKHKCKIEANGQIFFIDQARQKHVLEIGRNVVGRDASSAIIIDPSLRDISRVHLIIENLGRNLLRLTDLSAHGTYIPPEFSKEHAS